MYVLVMESPDEESSVTAGLGPPYKRPALAMTITESYCILSGVLLYPVLSF